MAKVSSRTVRVLEIPLETEKSDFLKLAGDLSSKVVGSGWAPPWSTPATDEKPVTSFAPQYDGYCGTITLPTEKHKSDALENHATVWRFDDVFNGVTVLYCSLEPEIEYVDSLKPCILL